MFIEGAAGAADGTIGGTARADRVWAMELDSRGVLYWLDGNSGCSVRVANTTGAPISFFGGGQVLNVASGQTGSITGGGCSAGVGTRANTGFAVNSRGLAVLERTPGTIEGWFVSNFSNDRITFINNTGSEITYGGTAIAAYESGYVTHVSAGFNGQQVGNQARTNEPYGLAYLSFYNALAFGDYANFRFRVLDLSIDQGQIATLAGEDRKYGNSGDGSKAPNDMVIYNPRGLAVDTLRKVLYFSDTTNGRIRAVDLTTGLVTTAIGRGRSSGLSGVNPENATDVYTGGTGPRRLFAIGNGGLLWVDRDGGGASRSCVVRTYNPLLSAFNFLNVLIGAGKVASVIGDWAFGCDDHTEGAIATLSALNQPEGVLYDGQNVYVSVEGNDCILKVSTADQKVTSLVGNCGNVGYQDGLLSDPAVRLRDPSAMALDPTYAADGNFYFVDAYNSGTSYLRYVNQRPTSVEISGITIPGNSVGTLVTSGSNYRIKAIAAFDSQYCFSRGQDNLGPHNVICRNRDDDLGNTTLRVGSSDSSPVQAGTPMGSEQEGISSSNATLYEPIGLAFDQDGNLYISEEDSHQIRKVMRWW